MPMQDSDRTAPRRRKGFLSWLCAAAATLIGIGMVGTALWAFLQVHPTEGRMEQSADFPWQGEGISVADARGWWKTAKDDDRMALRSRFYPVARVRLGACQGSGLLVLTFHDEMGRQVGDPVHLPYEEGKFRRQDAAWVRTTEDTAFCRIEVGFDNNDGLLLQQIQPDARLWSIRLRYRTNEERSLHRIGYIAIEPREQKTEE